MTFKNPDDLLRSRDVVPNTDDAESQDLKASDNLLPGCIPRELHTMTSATKVSNRSSVSRISREKVSIWNRIADFTSARASSYVSPSPTTTPLRPMGYAIYPSGCFSTMIFRGFSCIVPCLSFSVGNDCK